MLPPPSNPSQSAPGGPKGDEPAADPIAWVVNLEESDRIAAFDAVTQTRAALAAKRPDLLVIGQGVSARTGPILYEGRETAAELRFTPNQVQLGLALPFEDTTMLIVMTYPQSQLGRELPFFERADLVLGEWCDGLGTATLPEAHARIAASNQRLTEIATWALDDYSIRWATGILWPASEGAALSLIEDPSAGTASREFRGSVPTGAEGAISPALASCLKEATIRQVFVDGERKGRAEYIEELRLWIGDPPRLVFHNITDPIAKLRMLSQAAPLPPDARLIPPTGPTRP